ncbi:MAG TPA: diguanylate cyclase [Gemmatimonadaceae bacterium]|nr:diguanylate cyclase [Gemmatimonadaceae bacterium]
MRWGLTRRRSPSCSEVLSIRIDDLTKLPLRSAFIEQLSAALEIASATSQPVSLMVIDIDLFKLVNDTYGHLQGDRVLVEIADLLRQNLRADDLAARYAGDELVALLPNTPAERAREVAERLCAAVRGHAFLVRDRDERLSTSISIGVATSPEHGGDPDALFAAADRALYQVKRHGRDGVAVAKAGTAEGDHLPLGIERFVGRVTELRQLVNLLDDAKAGRPAIVAIAGEAGIGKTTLLRQLEPEVRLRSGSLVIGRGREADVQPPYAPWAEVIAAIRRTSPVNHRTWHELPHLVPALADADPRPRGSRVGSKYMLLEEISEYVRAAARDRLLVIVLDDVQWADSASWDMLEFLVGHLVSERLLICLTIRAEEMQGETLERRRRLSRNERFRELTLARLTREELKQWLQAAFHRQEIGRELLAFLYHHTEGNPLFVVQVLRTLLEEGAIWYDRDHWEWHPVSELRLPVAVTDLISRRLSRLTPRAQAVLTTVAVIGREFDLDLAIDAKAGTEEELLDVIDEGMRASVLQPAAARGGDRYAFAHVLMAEVLTESVNSRRLRRMHEQVAQAMERRTPEAIAEIATHYDRGGVSAKAHQYAMHAAERARMVYAHQECADFLRIAERNATSGAELAEVRVRRAEVAESVGRYDEAEEMCDLAIEWFTGQGDIRRSLALRRSRERIRALLGQPNGRTLEHCLALDAEAETHGFDDERVPLLTMISQTYGRLGDRAEAERVAVECVRIARELGDPPRLAESLNRLGITLAQDEPERAIEHYQRALELFERAGDLVGQARCRNNIGIVYSGLGDWQRATHELNTAMTLARNAGTPEHVGTAGINLGVAHLKCGDFDLARELFGEALAIFAAQKSTERQLYALYNLAHLERERGEYTAARELYDAVLGIARAIGQSDVELGALAGEGLALLRLGLVDDARVSLDDVEARMQARPDWFQGRELAEALRVRVAALESMTGAVARFYRALALAETSDFYGAAWLIAECADILDAHDRALLRSSVNRFAPQVQSQGYHGMSRRYTELLARK